MSDRTIPLLLRTIEPARGRAWHGGPTPVGALRGVTAEQAAWVPAPGRSSIWALTLHIAYWKYAVRRHLVGGRAPRFPRSPANFPAVPSSPTEAAWREDCWLAAEEHRTFVEAVKQFDPRKLDRRSPTGRRWTYGEMISGIMAHDAYHTGQIQLIKRLWEERGGR
jgi:uncharacterized damage-inducible protein DinB